MKKTTKITLLGMLLVLLVIGGCAKNNPQIVAEVNGTKITKEELDLKLEQIKSMFEMQGFAFEGEEGAEMIALLERETLNQLIMEIVLKEEAKKEEIVVTAEEVQENLDRIAEPYGQEGFAEVLKQQGMTEKQLKTEIELMLFREKLFTKMTAGIDISDSQVEEYYQANKEDLAEYRASHILIIPDEKAEDQQLAGQEALGKTIALIQDLNQGADFAELAKIHSADGSAEAGGDLGQFFNKLDSPYVPEFTEAAVELEAGEYTKEPVESFFGYHIIKITEKKDSLAELRAGVEARLEINEKNKFFDDYLLKVREQAQVVNYLEQEDIDSDVDTD